MIAHNHGEWSLDISSHIWHRPHVRAHHLRYGMLLKVLSITTLFIILCIKIVFNQFYVIIYHAVVSFRSSASLVYKSLLGCNAYLSD